MTIDFTLYISIGLERGVLMPYLAMQAITNIT